MLYRAGYKYQLAADEYFYTSFRPVNTIRAPRITLYTDGAMIVNEGYSWDGATGIPDLRTNMRASCGHDALYQLMRLKKLDWKEYGKADDDFAKWMREAGAWSITVNTLRWGLQQMAGTFAKPENRREIYTV